MRNFKYNYKMNSEKIDLYKNVFLLSKKIYILKYKLKESYKIIQKTIFLIRNRLIKHWKYSYST